MEQQHQVQQLPEHTPEKPVSLHTMRFAINLSCRAGYVEGNLDYGMLVVLPVPAYALVLYSDTDPTKVNLTPKLDPENKLSNVSHAEFKRNIRYSKTTTIPNHYSVINSI